MAFLLFVLFPLVWAQLPTIEVDRHTLVPFGVHDDVNTYPSLSTMFDTYRSRHISAASKNSYRQSRDEILQNAKSPVAVGQQLISISGTIQTQELTQLLVAHLVQSFKDILIIARDLNLKIITSLAPNLNSPPSVFEANCKAIPELAVIASSITRQMTTDLACSTLAGRLQFEIPALQSIIQQAARSQGAIVQLENIVLDGATKDEIWNFVLRNPLYPRILQNLFVNQVVTSFTQKYSPAYEVIIANRDIVFDLLGTELSEIEARFFELWQKIKNM